MKVIGDFHIHSRFARACSTALGIKNLAKWGKVKGISVLGTGDFCHPKYQEEIKQELVREEDGIYYTKDDYPFVLTVEISSMYGDGVKSRKVHNLLMAPSMEVVDQVTEFLGKYGNLTADGRPIIGRKLDCPGLVEGLMSISKDIEITPAHAYTPYFGVFGSISGFDSLEECFKDQTKHIHSIETGMSSTPDMNWRIKDLDKITLMSNSDCHSFWPHRLGREANVFDLKKLTYSNIVKAIRDPSNGFEGTIEVDSGYGKYHFDGHAACGVSMHPNESNKLNKLCPKCGKKMTIGVLNRVEELAEPDRPEGFNPGNRPGFKTLIPLSEVISGVMNTTPLTKKTWTIYDLLIEKFGNEYNVLLDVPKEELDKVIGEKLSNAILKNRLGEIKVKPGFDGEYGIPLFEESERENTNPRIGKKQKTLMEF